MKRLKKKFLFSLASELDFLNKSEGFGYHNYEYLYYRLSEYAKGSVRDAGSGLVSQGAVDKVIKGSRAWFRLTGVGREKLLNAIGLKQDQKRAWDRTWRLVVFERLEDDSRTVEKVLKKFGYRRLARGVWLTPLMVSEATKQLFLKKNWTLQAKVMEVKRLIIGDDKQLARRLWKLDACQQKYTGFVIEANKLLKTARASLVLLKQSKKGFKPVFDQYYQLVVSDPGLPVRLLPSDWQAEKAKELFFRLVELTKTAKI